MGTVAGWVDTVVEAARTGDEPAFTKVRDEVEILMGTHPVPGLPVS
ncbi:hypothetical protein ACIQWZ_01315 [Streptomyces sp. NPDC098077]